MALETRCNLTSRRPRCLTADEIEQLCTVQADELQGRVKSAVDNGNNFVELEIELERDEEPAMKMLCCL